MVAQVHARVGGTLRVGNTPAYGGRYVWRAARGMRWQGCLEGIVLQVILHVVWLRSGHVQEVAAPAHGLNMRETLSADKRAPAFQHGSYYYFIAHSENYTCLLIPCSSGKI